MTHMEERDRIGLLKRLDDELTHNEQIKRRISEVDENIVETESYLEAMLSVLFYDKKKQSPKKYLEFEDHVPVPCIDKFPFFVRSTHFILAVYNMGVPTKHINLKYYKNYVIYTVGYKSKRLYYKHKYHDKIDDDYIFYTCRTKHKESKLLFEITSDDGLFISGDPIFVYNALKSSFVNPIEFKTTEEFFGIDSDEVVKFMKDKYSIGNKKNE